MEAWGKRITIDWWWGEVMKNLCRWRKIPSNIGKQEVRINMECYGREPPFPIHFDSPFCRVSPNHPIDGNGTSVINRFQIAIRYLFKNRLKHAWSDIKKGQWGRKQTIVLRSTVSLVRTIELYKNLFEIERLLFLKFCR